MQVTETLSEGLKREYQITIEAGDLEGRMSSRLTELARNVQLPGFRKGKVPVPLLRRTYGKQVLGEVLEQTVNETSTQALEQNELKPAMQPRIEITKFEEGADLEYKMSVEVMPDFEPVDFKTLELERQVAEVTDEEVDKRLAQVAEQFKTFEDAAEGQAAQSGDSIVMDFKGTMDGEAFEGGSAEDYELELGSGRFIPGFEDQLIGAKAGENKTVNVTFPEDYGAEALAGKDVSFDVTVKAVKVPLPTAVDDAMAEKLGLENLDALKTAMREQIERDYGELSRSRLKRSLLDALAEAHTFEVPPGMVDMEFDQIWKQVEHDLEHQGKTIADLDKPEDEARQEYREIAERRVRLGLLLSEVGRQNNLQVTQDEVNRAIAQQASRFPGQEQQVMEFYRDNPQMQAQLQAPILEDKVVDFIVEMATVTDKTVPIDELLHDPDEDENQHHHHHDHDHDHDH